MYAISRFRCKSTMVVWICRVCATLTEVLYMAQKREVSIANWRWPSPTRYIHIEASSNCIPLPTYPATSTRIPYRLLIRMQTEISDNKPRATIEMTLAQRKK
jgi:hypothetical protein